MAAATATDSAALRVRFATVERLSAFCEMFMEISFSCVLGGGSVRAVSQCVRPVRAAGACDRPVGPTRQMTSGWQSPQRSGVT
ncbi:hypothetical protein GCM10009760_21770 [Kitasatospora kazusensis]|uniref:Uncharacterized protein n=1 Tax=Kitasatospora kazusensis TaxID=407974 RepID=A0ABN2ZAU4_9ACTN